MGNLMISSADENKFVEDEMGGPYSPNWGEDERI
jgi:hypothetical protein